MRSAPLAALCRFLPPYSYLSASTGSSRAARLAGYSPNPTPVRADAPSAATMDHSGTWAGIGVSRETPKASRPRSEEHTSELQSLAYLVCRLLLEKKKKKTNTRTVDKENNYRTQSLI